eukprot:jgi/Mesvir1/16959/Mv15808-RA.1
MAELNLSRNFAVYKEGFVMDYLPIAYSQEYEEEQGEDMACHAPMTKQTSLPSSFPEHSRPLLHKVPSYASVYDLEREARRGAQQQQPWGKVGLGASSSVTDLTRLAAEAHEADAAVGSATPCTIFPGPCNCRIRCGPAMDAVEAISRIWMGKGVTPGDVDAGRDELGGGVSTRASPPPQQGHAHVAAHGRGHSAHGHNTAHGHAIHGHIGAHGHSTGHSTGHGSAHARPVHGHTAHDHGSTDGVTERAVCGGGHRSGRPAILSRLSFGRSASIMGEGNDKRAGGQEPHAAPEGQGGLVIPAGLAFLISGSHADVVTSVTTSGTVSPASDVSLSPASVELQGAWGSASPGGAHNGVSGCAVCSGGGVGATPGRESAPDEAGSLLGLGGSLTAGSSGGSWIGGSDHASGGAAVGEGADASGNLAAAVVAWAASPEKTFSGNGGGADGMAGATHHILVTGAGDGNHVAGSSNHGSVTGAGNNVVSGPGSASVTVAGGSNYVGCHSVSHPYLTSGAHGVVPGSSAQPTQVGTFPSSIRRLRSRSLTPTPLMRVAAVGKMLAQPLAVLDALLLAEGTSGPTAERLAEMRRMLTFIQGYCCEAKPAPGDTASGASGAPRSALSLKPTRASHGNYGSPAALGSAREALTRRPRISMDAALGMPDGRVHANNRPTMALEELAVEEAAACLRLWGAAPPMYVSSPAAASLTEDAEVRNWLETNFGLQDRHKPTLTNRSSVEMLKAENKRRRPSMTGELAGAGRPLVDNSGRTDSSHYFKAALLRLGSWNFDSFRLDRATKGHPLVAVMVELLHKERLVEKFHLDDAKVVRYFTAVEQSMEAYSNPFHNRIHVADVVVSLYHLIIGPDVAQYLKPLHVLGALIAAAVHDFGHKGRTNDFLAKVDDPQALRYNLRSVNENMHVSEAIKLLLKPENNFLSSLEPEDMVTLRTLIVDLVLATDLSKHFRFVDLLKARAVTNSNLAAGAGGGAGAVAAGGAASGPPFNASVPADVTLVLQLALKCSDLGHSAKSLNIHLKWTLAMEEEFYRQGDEEQRRGMAISPFMDRQKADGVVKSQASFFHFVSLPLYQAWSSVFPRSATILDSCRRNLAFWESADSLSHYRSGEWMAKHVPHNFTVTRDGATGVIVTTPPPIDPPPTYYPSHDSPALSPSADNAGTQSFPMPLQHGSGALGSASPQTWGNGSRGHTQGQHHGGRGHHVTSASSLSAASGRSGTGSDTLSQLLRAREQPADQYLRDDTEGDVDREGDLRDSPSGSSTRGEERGLQGGDRNGSPFLVHSHPMVAVPFPSLAGASTGGVRADIRPRARSNLRGPVISESSSSTPESTTARGDDSNSSGSNNVAGTSYAYLSSWSDSGVEAGPSAGQRRSNLAASRLGATQGMQGMGGSLGGSGGGDSSNDAFLVNDVLNAMAQYGSPGAIIRDRSFSYPPPEGPDRGPLGAAVAGATGGGGGYSLIRGSVMQYLPQTLQVAGGGVQWGGPVNMETRDMKPSTPESMSDPGQPRSGGDRSRSEQPLTAYSRALLATAVAKQAAEVKGPATALSGIQEMRRVLGTSGNCSRLQHTDGCCEYADAEDNLAIAERFRRPRSRSVSDQGGS